MNYRQMSLIGIVAMLALPAWGQDTPEIADHHRITVELSKVFNEARDFRAIDFTAHKDWDTFCWGMRLLIDEHTAPELSTVTSVGYHVNRAGEFRDKYDQSAAWRFADNVLSTDAFPSPAGYGRRAVARITNNGNLVIKAGGPVNYFWLLCGQSLFHRE
jgi:hypothetical protein